MWKKGIVSKNEKETIKIAGEFAKTLRGGEVVLLEGDLGAGKTTFVRGLARAFGIKEPIRSPTFTLMQVYRIKNKELGIRELVHVDAYRLRGTADLRAIGIEEYSGKKNTVTIIEWGRRVQKVFPTRSLIIITFHHGQTSDERIIEYGVFSKSGRPAR